MTMKTFLICSRDAGVLGLYEAASEADAHDVFARAAGYRNCADEAAVLSTTVERLRADLTITEVDLAATVEALAAAMVAMDRESSDCDDVRDDADAGDASHWDTGGLVSVADDAGVDRTVARAIAYMHFYDVRAAYAIAWREAARSSSTARDDDAA